MVGNPNTWWGGNPHHVHAWPGKPASQLFKKRKVTGITYQVSVLNWSVLSEILIRFRTYRKYAHLDPILNTHTHSHLHQTNVGTQAIRGRSKDMVGLVLTPIKTTHGPCDMGMRAVRFCVGCMAANVALYTVCVCLRRYPWCTRTWYREPSYHQMGP